MIYEKVHKKCKLINKWQFKEKTPPLEVGSSGSLSPTSYNTGGDTGVSEDDIMEYSTKLRSDENLFSTSESVHSG